MRSDIFISLVILGIILAPSQARAENDSLGSMSLEELMAVEVFSAAKRPTSAYETAAAITVITSDDLRRNGITTLVDALEWVPGVQFQRLNASNTAVGIRGFSGVLSDKLLVLIDGRSIYSLFYSGVYWDEHVLPIEDIERIEIIRGPGGTLWGANAVNGVINVVTREASETLGWRASADLSGDESSLQFRAGAPLGDRTDGRFWMTAHDRDAFDTAPDHYGGGDWRNISFGSRVDVENFAGGDLVLTAGGLSVETERQDILHDPVTHLDQFVEPGMHETMALNALARWERPIVGSSTLMLQSWFEYHDRDERIFSERRTSFDFDAQITRPGDVHSFVAGANLRVSADEVDGSTTYEFNPRAETLTWSSVFLQDEIRLHERLRVTAGIKLEHNDYTGFEHQPNLRAGLDTGRFGFLWGAVSRAVRTPSRAYTSTNANRNITETLGPGGYPIAIALQPQVVPTSETLVAYELGWRRPFGESVSIDVTGFVHRYADLMYQTTLQPSLVVDGITDPYYSVPVELMNGVEMTGQGVEAVVDTKPFDKVQLHLGYSFLDLEVDRVPEGSADQTGFGFLNNNVEDSPVHTGFARLRVNPAPAWDVDLGLRMTSALDDVPVEQPIQRPSVDGTTELSVRIAWRPFVGTEVALLGRNLIDDGRVDYYDRSDVYPSGEIPAQVFLQLRFDR